MILCKPHRTIPQITGKRKWKIQGASGTAYLAMCAPFIAGRVRMRGKMRACVFTTRPKRHYTHDVIVLARKCIAQQPPSARRRSAHTHKMRCDAHPPTQQLNHTQHTSKMHRTYVKTSCTGPGRNGPINTHMHITHTLVVVAYF